MVLPILEYNSAIYNFTKAQNSQKLQRIQNRAIRIITKTDKTTSTPELQNKLTLQPLHRRWQNRLLTLMHIRSRNPTHTQTAHRTTRQTSKYPTPKYNYSETHLATKGPKCGMRSQRRTKPLNLHISPNPHLATTKPTITNYHITPEWPSKPSPIVNSSTQDLSHHHLSFTQALT